MARKIHEFKFTREQLDDILARGDSNPFVIWHDEIAGVYRFFPDEERKQAWVDAYVNDNMTPEIAEYEFADPITAPAPYTVNITVIDDNRYILDGVEGVTLDFTFETRDGNQGLVQESVDVYYTFRSPAGTKTAASVYNPGTQVHMNIDNYISLGTNTIAIMVKGRATGASKTIIATYNVVKLSLSSNFQIARSLEPNTPFDVTYTIEGDADKVVEFYIDGVLASNATVSSLEPVATKVQRLNGLNPGKHTLQMVAKMQIGTYLFRSKLLYYEFIVKGVDLTTTVIAEQFPYTQDVFSGSVPGLNGEQYVIKTINWAYYSSDYYMLNATIQWRLYTEAGDETPLATRNTDVVEAETDVAPEPLQFMPTEYGAYHLQALINGVIIGDYTIAVIKNTAGILETTDGLTMKLSGLGRDNAEPVETLTSWADRGFSTTFFNQPWNGNSGWNNNALVLNNGATARINNKPFASEIAPQTRNGCVFEIDFETFNVNNDEAELLRIGGIGSASLVITPSKAVLKSSFGRTIESRFKSDERIKIAFVIYPNNSTDYYRKVFVYNNGVMSGVINYELADNFNIGELADTESTIGMINLGNANGDAGIKIYYIRTYSNIINMYEELNNYFIDSGENLQYLVNDNDIYAEGTKLIDIDKLEGTITTVKMTGPINELINRGSGKGSVTSKLEVVCPTNSNINLTCDLAQITNAGQSTLDKPVPSFHVKLDKNGNICYDRDGKIYSKNRWAFREGNVPEKKFRLQANYMDSSGCHNGSFLRMFNEVAPRVKINNKSVLRIPSEVYASDQYAAAMQNIHGQDPSGNNWKFPYNIHMTPDSIPCVVVWRPDESSAYRFLGQYVIMEEKKANYANGMHSIYSGLDADGKADPFGFKSSKTGEKLWDNANCHQMEILRSTEDLTLFLNDSNWEEDRDESFELVYPDEDDLTPAEIEAEWQKFYRDVVHPIVSTRGNQEAFNLLLYGSNPKLDRWHFAAYYCLAMRNACTDSMVRNMEFVTYDGNVWMPKWWDVDMQCGLQQTGECNIVPSSDRTTLAPGSTTAFAFSGRMYVGGVLKSSWLWDALEGSEQFMQDVKTMDAALYAAGWTYNQVTTKQDEEYIDAWSNALFNESSVSKYLAYNDLPALQGDRTPHRHWFLRTSYDYFDALHVCGEYTSKLISIRTQSIAPNKTISFKSAFTSYFGWGYTTNIIQSGIRVEKGQTGELTIDRTLALNDPLHIFAANKIAEIDLSQISENIAGSDVDFSGTYDDLLGSQLKKLILGVPKARMNTGVFNLSTSATEIQGITTFNRMEYLDIQGMQYFVGLDMSAMHSLTHFYAAGARLDSFNPASGSNLKVVELPTTVTSMQMDGCNLTGVNNECVIKWYETIYDNDLPVRVEEVGIPSTLRVLILSGMGTNLGTQQLVFDWLNSVYDDYGDEGLAQLQITCRNVNWENVPVSDLLKLSKIPAAARTVTGRIKCSGTLTGLDIVNIQNAFGEQVFTNNPGVTLRIDADSGFILGAPETVLAGNNALITGVAFPIAEATAVTYRLGQYDGNHNFVPQARLIDENNNAYYRYKDAILYESTGRLVTYETAENDYSFVVEGATQIVADYATIQVLKRSYPSGVNINFTYTEGKNVSLNEMDHRWYITSDDLTLHFESSVTPADITGTVVSEVWTISDGISGLCSININTNNTFEVYVQSSGATLSTGTITHTKTYIEGTVVSKSIPFAFKSPITAVTSRHNPILQTELFNAGYAANAGYTTDVELWFVPNLDFLIKKDWRNSGGYIESNGSQYFDIGIVPTTGTVVKIKAIRPMFGVCHQGNGNGMWFASMPSSNTNCEFFLGTLSQKHVISNSGTLSEYELSYGEYLKRDGTTIYTGNQGIPVNSHSMYLFQAFNLQTNSPESRNFTSKLYSFIVEQNNTLVREMYPAVDSNGVVCMYDYVSKQYFYNSGAGEFTVSDEVKQTSKLVHLAELNNFINLDNTKLDLSRFSLLGSNDNLTDLEDSTQDYVNVLPRASQQLDLDFQEIDLSNTQLKGINLKSGNVLETITYGDQTEKVELVNQSALTEVNIPSDLDNLDKLVIENCNELEGIVWI